MGKKRNFATAADVATILSQSNQRLAGYKQEDIYRRRSILAADNKIKVDNDVKNAFETDPVTGEFKSIKINSTKGRKFDELDPEVKKIILQVEDADKEAKALQKQREKKQSTFGKVIDVISRPIYGVAEGIKDAQTELNTQRYKKDHRNWFSRGADQVKALGGGVVEGVTGKEKTYFSEVIQSLADQEKAQKAGGDPRLAAYGSAKVNPYVKFGVGLTADIFLDPTTYTGVGTVGKAAGIGKLIKTGEEANNARRILTASEAIKDVNAKGAAVKKLTEVGHSLPEANQLVQAAAAPIEVIGKRTLKDFSKKHLADLTPEGAAVIKVAKDERKILGPKAYDKKYRAKNGGSSAAVGSKITEGLTQGKTLRKAIEESANTLYKTAYSAAVAEATVKVDRSLGKAKGFPAGLGVSTAAQVPKKLAKVSPYKHNMVYSLANVVKEANKAGAIDRGLVARALTKGAKPATVKQTNRAIESLKAVGVIDTRVLPDTGELIMRLKPGVSESAAVNKIILEGVKATRREAELYATTKLGMSKSEAFRYARSPEAMPVTKAAAQEAATRTRAINQVATATLASKNIGSAAEIAKELTAVSLRGGSSGVVRSVGLRVGKKTFTLPDGVANMAVAGKGAVASVPQIRRSLNFFNANFRATAFISPSLRRVLSSTQAVGNEYTRMYGKELVNVFKGVSKKERRHIVKMWAANTTDGLRGGGKTYLTGKEVDNLGHYFDGEIKEIAATFDRLGMSTKELNGWLPAAYRIAATDQKTVTKKLKTGQVVETTEFAKTQGLLLNHLIKAGAKDGFDPAEALFLYSSAVNKVAAAKSFRAEAAGIFGVPLRSIVQAEGSKAGTVSNRLAESLMSGPSAYREVKGVKDLAGHVFHPEIATALERMEDVFFKGQGGVVGGHGGIDGFLNGFDKVQQSFKSLVTRGTPSFYVRTLMGEVILGQIGGMRNVVGSYSKATRVIAGRNKVAFGDTAAAMNGIKQGRKANSITNVLSGNAAFGARMAADGASKIVKTKYGHFTADEIWHHYLNSGLKSSFASTDLIRGAGPGAFGKLNPRTAIDSTQAVLENVEDVGRLAHFIDTLQHSTYKTLQEALDDAAEVVSKYHLDYTAVTKTEKQVMTRLMPFYKWMRLSTPLMVDILLTQPGKALVLPKGLAALSGAAGYDQANGYGVLPGGVDAVVPDYLIDHGAVPIGTRNGVTQWFDPQAIFPFVGSGEVASTNPLRNISPLLKVPFDLAQNDNSAFEGNAPIRTGENGKFDFGTLQKYLASLTPQTQLAQQLSQPTDPQIDAQQRLFNFLINPGIQPNTDKRIEGQAYEDRRKAQQNRKDARIAAGLTPDDIKELTKQQAKRSKKRNLELGLTQPK